MFCICEFSRNKYIHILFCAGKRKKNNALNMSWDAMSGFKVKSSIIYRRRTDSHGLPPSLRATTIDCYLIYMDLLLGIGIVILYVNSYCTYYLDMIYLDYHIIEYHH